MESKRKSRKVAERDEPPDSEVEETAGTRPRRKSKKVDCKPDPSDMEDEETPGMRLRRKSKDVDYKPDSSDEEDGETPEVEPRRKSTKAVRNSDSNTTEKKQKRKSTKVDDEPNYSDLDDEETPVSVFGYEAAIKKMSGSSVLKRKLLELCRRVEKTFVMTDKQLAKIRAFKCEVADLKNMQNEFPLSRGIYRADVGEKSFSTSAFTGEELHTIGENYARFCKKFGFHPKEDLHVFLPSTFFKRNGFDNLSQQQEQVFCRHLSKNINRPPRSVYKKFAKMYYFYRKGPYTEEEDELLLRWYELNPGKHKYSFLARILHRSRQLVRRRTLRLLGEEDPSEKSRNKTHRVAKAYVDDIKMHENDEYPDWTMQEEAWREIAEANGESTVKQLKKSYFRDLYPSVKASSAVSSDKFRHTLITKLMSLKNPTWDSVDWIKLGQDCFNVGAVRVYSAIRTLTKKYVPKEHWKDLAAALKTIEEKHHLFNGPKKAFAIEDTGAVSDSASSAVSSCSSQLATRKAKSVVEQQSRNTEREDGVQVEGSGHTSDESDSRERFDSLSDSCSSRDDEAAVAPRSGKEKLGNVTMETEKLNTVPFDDDRITHTVADSPKKRKKLRKTSKENLDSCSVTCEDQSVETSDGGTRKNSDSGDPLSTVGNPDVTGSECIDSDTDERKLKFEESDSKISPKKKLVESDQLTDDRIAHSVPDSPRKRKKLLTKSEETLDSCGMTSEGQSVENSDGVASRKNTDSGDLLTVEESDSKISPKKKLVESDQLTDDRIAHSVPDSPRKRKKLLTKSEETLDSCGMTSEGQSVENADGVASRKNTDSGDLLTVEESDSKISPKKKLVESDQLIDDRIAHSVADSPRKRKKLRKTSKENLDSHGVTYEDQSVENSDGGMWKNSDSEDPLSTVGNTNFDANALDVTVSECIDSDKKDLKSKVEEFECKVSPKKILLESDHLIDVEPGKGSPRRFRIGDFVLRRRGKKRRKD